MLAARAHRCGEKILQDGDEKSQTIKMWLLSLPDPREI